MTRVLQPIRFPNREVIAETLNLYQVAFRKSSCTAYVLDFSGSMANHGEDDLKTAMRTLLDQDVASQYLLQGTPGDVSTVILFNQDIINQNNLDQWTVAGNDATALQHLQRQIQAIDAGGNTNIFDVITTDPTRSNSGNMLYGLFANMLAGGQVATLTTLTDELPTIKAYFENQGYMEESSGVLFDRFINTGMGANPIIANCESLLIEFSVAHQDSLDMIRSQIRVIYPTPTVWSARPLIARTANGKLLIEALKDEQLQRIAWAQHGFRSGLIGVQNDLSVLKIASIPAQVDSVMPLPRADAMIAMLDYLKQSDAAGTQAPTSTP